MLKFLKYGCLLALAACLFLVQPVMAQGIKGNLVTVDWLEKNLKKPDVLILDASPTQNYVAKHIPGAVSVSFTQEESTSQGVNLSYGGGVDYFTDTNCPYPWQEMPIAQMEKLFQSWGISPNRKIVMYDQGGTMLATRLFFSLYYHGIPVKNLFILDGGLAKWQGDGFPVTKDIPSAPKKGTFKIKKVKQDIKATLPEIIAASGDPVHNVLLEALWPNWHYGELLSYSRPGHIPHAILLPSTDFYNQDKTFKSADEIRRMLTYLGIRPEQTVYTH
jgi:thiosulfate/3-mercaptopyruvate sulfurtransferase